MGTSLEYAGCKDAVVGCKGAQDGLNAVIQRLSPAPFSKAEPLV